MREKLLAEAKIIADMVGDSNNSYWFHYKAVATLGFQACYELASYAVDRYRMGKITDIGRYYNGCIKRELDEFGKRNKR